MKKLTKLHVKVTESPIGSSFSDGRTSTSMFVQLLDFNTEIVGNLILRLRKVGARLGQGLEQGWGKVGARSGQGPGKVRAKSKVGARFGQARSGQGWGKVGARLGQGLDKKQGCGKVWTS
jgi:hypothetical protein